MAGPQWPGIQGVPGPGGQPLAAGPASAEQLESLHPARGGAVVFGPKRRAVTRPRASGSVNLNSDGPGPGPADGRASQGHNAQPESSLEVEQAQAARDRPGTRAAHVT